ncbi:MAG: hypothetical protein KBA30_09335 [Clostridia bacterium]|nr:hypothetical protein [Clostridia bacterium]
MRKHICESMVDELNRNGFSCRMDEDSDITVYAGDGSPFCTAEPAATVGVREDRHTVLVWVPAEQERRRADLLDSLWSAIRPDGWRLRTVGSREETKREDRFTASAVRNRTPATGAGEGVPGDSPVPAPRAAFPVRFRAARYGMMAVYALLAAFFGLLLNLRTAGWLGTLILLLLIGVVSGKASRKGCLPTMLVWGVGLIGILVVFALSVRI